MGIAVFPAPSSATAPQPLATAVPAGLTLQRTYTSTTTGITWPADITQVYVLAAGGGGNGASAGASGGGGGGGAGAVIQGWIKTFSTVTIAAGAGVTRIDGLIAAQGGRGGNYQGQLPTSAGAGGGQGGKGGGTAQPEFASSAFLTSVGGAPDAGIGTSGGGAAYNAGAGGLGVYAGGGGAGASGGAGGAGLFAGGTAPGASPGSGGGGGGIVGAGSNGTAGSNQTGGTGGSGGGGGGGGAGTYGGGGAGGAGAVLVYY